MADENENVDPPEPEPKPEPERHEQHEHQVPANAEDLVTRLESVTNKLISTLESIGNQVAGAAPSGDQVTHPADETPDRKPWTHRW